MLVINKQVFENAVMRYDGTAQTLADQMKECKAEGWSLDTFEGYMLQFCKEEGLRPFLETVWND